VPVVVPAAVRTGAGRAPGGAAWLARLPELVARALERWDLRAGEPFASGSASWCAPVTGPDGADLVLKVAYPHDEARDEAAVLRAWDGSGAPRLVDAHAGDWALLLERVRPGTPLRAARTPVRRRLAEGAGVLRALHGSATPAVVPDLTAVAAGWAGLMERRAAAHPATGLDPGLLTSALDVLRAPAPARLVLLHGDLNPGNLLRAPGGWCAIDPKAMRGDPAYDPWPLLEQVGAPWRTPDPVRELRDRTRLVAERAALDPVAVASWSHARSTEQALWLAAHGARPSEVAATWRRSRAWAEVRDALAG